MAYYLNTVTLADGYEAETTLGPFEDADTVTVLVSGNPASMRFHIGRGTDGRWTDDREFVAPAGAGSTNSFRVANVNGIKLRNTNPGQNAVVSVVLFRTGVTYDSSDPIFDAGSLSPGAITATGNVQQPVSGFLSGTQVVVGDGATDTFTINLPSSFVTAFNGAIAGNGDYTAAGSGSITVVGVHDNGTLDSFDVALSAAPGAGVLYRIDWIAFGT